MTKPTTPTNTTPTPFRVGPLVFSGLKFSIYSALALIIAMTAGSLLTPANQGDSLGQLIISSQGITVVLLALWAGFVRTGIKSHPIGKNSVAGICVLAFAAGQIAHQLIPLRGFLG